MATSGAVRTVAEGELWSALVRASVGALGLTLLAVGPLVPTPDEFPALRVYTFVIGGILVLVGASVRHRPVLTVLGCIALAAGLASSIVGEGQPMASRAALALDSGAAILVGAVIRRPWAAAPFLLVPLLIVAAGPPGSWGAGQEEFAPAWTARMGCECGLPGIPAALAMVGAAIGQAMARPWRSVRPSALPVILAAGGAMGAALVVHSVLPAGADLAGLVLARTALVLGILAWIGIAYHAGRRSFVVEAGILGLLVLVGRLYADPAIRYPESYDLTMLATVLASTLPAILAGLGLMVRQWIGTEGPETVTAPNLDFRAFFREERKARHVEQRQPLHAGGFGPRDRPDEVHTGGSGGDGGNE